MCTALHWTTDVDRSTVHPVPARHYAYYSEWESEILTCPNCGWRGTFMDGDTEHYEQLMDTSCPQCDDAPMLAIVSYPTREETRANLDKLSPEEQQLCFPLCLFCFTFFFRRPSRHMLEFLFGQLGTLGHLDISY